MKIAVITMVYNERINLPVWVGHYSAQCPGCELFVIDHGSDESVRETLDGVNVLRIPRSDFDERRRAEMVTRLHGMLLLEFDWVLHTDCDELVVSRSGETLSQSLENEGEDVSAVTAVGMNLWHRVGTEPALDRTRPIGEQRRYATFEKSMCKPFASRVPIAWIPGFHTSNLPPHFGLGYYLVHAKYVDYDEAEGRLKLTTGLNWSAEALEKGWSSHQRIDAGKLRRKFEGIAGFVDKGAVSEFDFDEEPVRFVEGCVEDSNGNWRCDTVFPGKIVQIPQDVLDRLP